MLLSDKIKKFSVEQAIDYRNRNPVKNLQKLLDRADTFCAGKFEGQRRAISLEGDETTTDSRRSEKEVKREQRTQKHRLPVGRRCFFQPSPRGDGQGTQSRTGKSVISAAGAAPRDSKTKKRAWKDPSMHVSGQMGFPGLALRRVSCAGRGPGSGCAAARGRGPGAGRIHIHSRRQGQIDPAREKRFSSCLKGSSYSNRPHL